MRWMTWTSRQYQWPRYVLSCTLFLLNEKLSALVRRGPGEKHNQNAAAFWWLWIHEWVPNRDDDGRRSCPDHLRWYIGDYEGAHLANYLNKATLVYGHICFIIYTDGFGALDLHNDSSECLGAFQKSAHAGTKLFIVKPPVARVFLVVERIETLAHTVIAWLRLWWWIATFVVKKVWLRVGL